jgi:CO/xanthine dehydrogenase Mo-binding subunit
LFVDDLDPPGLLYGITLRSPTARGRLLSVEAPPLPPDCFLIRAQDIPGKNSLDEFEVPVLAAERLSYAGEPVALLIGPEKRSLEDIASECEVLTEEEMPRLGLTSFAEDALLARRSVTLGNPEKAFAEAKTVVEGIYRTGLQEHWYSEPTGALAEWPAGEQARVIVHTATQWPFQVRRSVAAVLGLEQGQVLVQPASIGIHLDGKIWYPSLLACHAALGAFIARRPVKVMLSRYEDFRYSPKRSPAEIHIRSALGEGGKLLGQELNAACDLGAYGVFTNEILDRICLGALGIYRQGHIKIDGKALSTNIPPTGSFMGFGLAQGFFAMERHAGLIAEKLGLNPLEWRKENAMTTKRPLAIGAPVPDELYLERLLDTAAAMGDFHRKWASYETLRRHRRAQGPGKEALRGIGIAAAYQSSGFLYAGADRGLYSVELTLDKKSHLDIKTSMISSNGEHINIWRNLASEILSITPDAVRILPGNTGNSPDSGPAALSRNITTVTRLVELACQAIRKQRFRDPLPITVQRSRRPQWGPGWFQNSLAPGESAPGELLAELAPAELPGVTAEASPAPPSPAPPIDQNAFARMGAGAVVVEVEIDPITYSPRIRGVWIGLNGGKIHSQKQAWRSIRYSVLQALGWASREFLSYEEGIIPDSQIRNYGLPDPEDAPPINIDFIWNDSSPSNGIDELPFSCIPAAYAQAVSQAADHPFTGIPIGARDIWNALRTREEEGS